MPDLPPLALLDAARQSGQESVSEETLEFTSRLIEKKLSDFGVEAKVVAAYPGPVITRYEIEPAIGVKGSQIVNLATDLARALSLVSHPRGRDHPRQEPAWASSCRTRSARSCGCPRSWARRSTPTAASPLTLALGKDIAGNPVVADLARMPHLLVARHHRLGQIGRDQRHDPVAAVQGRPVTRSG